MACKHCGFFGSNHRCCAFAAAEQDAVEEAVTISRVRKAIDEVLREADKVLLERERGSQDDHLWRDNEGAFRNECASHNEGLSCCLDPSHGSYDKLLDYLAEHVSRALEQP